MGMLFGVILFVFVLLAIIAGAAYVIDRSADTPGRSQGQ
jgi:hypothetical protein